MPIRNHILRLENTFGREVEAAVADDTTLWGEFVRLAGLAAGIACPVIFVNGRGYTSIPEFKESLQVVNLESIRAGGAPIYPIPA